MLLNEKNTLHRGIREILRKVYRKFKQKFTSLKAKALFCFNIGNKFTVSIRTILLNEMQNGYFNRYDIAVRYMAVEEYFGKNDFGFRLYSKMQDLRVKKGYAEEACIKFRQLIASYEEKKYDANSYILMDQNLDLQDGAHRITLALYYGIDRINARIMPVKWRADFSLGWFIENGFTSEEIEIIRKKAEEIISGLNRGALHAGIDTEKDYQQSSVRAFINSSFKRLEGSQFGRGNFYQSFTLLGLDGQRPTDFRISEYRLYELLREDMNVLDIGCNIGFLDMTVAGCVSSVLGIEYNKDLVNIAAQTAEMLGIKNCEFTCADFNEWCRENNSREFDVVFSFAVHYWLKVKPENYAQTINSLLKSGGYCVLESQNIHSNDKNFGDFVNAFCGYFSKCYEGRIMDDWIIERKWAVFRKE